MAKLSELDLVEAPTGDEYVPVLSGGIAKRARLGEMVAGAASPQVKKVGEDLALPDSKIAGVAANLEQLATIAANLIALLAAPGTTQAALAGVQAALANFPTYFAQAAATGSFFDISDGAGKVPFQILSDFSAYLDGAGDGTQSLQYLINRLITDANTRFRVRGTDPDGSDFFGFDVDRGAMHAADVIVPNGSLTEVNRRLEIIETSTALRPITSTIFHSSQLNGKPLGLSLTRLNTLAGGGSRYVYHIEDRTGAGGDSDPKSIRLRTFDLSPRGELLALGPIQSGESSYSDGTHTIYAGNTCVTRLDVGPYTGRVIEMFSWMYADETQGGLRITPKVGMRWTDTCLPGSWTLADITSKFPQLSTWKRLNFGPGAGRQLVMSKAHNGRVIIPSYTAPDLVRRTAIELISDDIAYLANPADCTFYGGLTDTPGSENQCCEDYVSGDLITMARSNNSPYKRLIRSADQGLSSYSTSILTDILTRECDSGIVQAKNRFDRAPPGVFIVSPYGPNGDAGGERVDACIWGCTNGNFDQWPNSVQTTMGYFNHPRIETGPSAEFLLVGGNTRDDAVQVIAIPKQSLLL